MTIYVDDLREWMGKSWCHMVSTNAAELEQMAVGHLGLREIEAMKDPEYGYTYYNITPKQRAAVLRLGGREITTEKLLARAKEVDR